MAHGYLKDYDDRWDRKEARDRVERDSREHDPRDRNFMLDDDRQWSAPHEGRWSSRDWRASGEDEWRSGHSAFTSGGDWDRAPRNFSNHPDDHYRSWRDRHMDALDRDYAAYCREREQQFHHDFDAWRSNRHGNNPGPLRTGMTETGQSLDPTGMLELTNEVADNEEPQPDPVDSATLGTNSSRGKR